MVSHRLSLVLIGFPGLPNIMWCRWFEIKCVPWISNACVQMNIRTSNACVQMNIRTLANAPWQQCMQTHTITTSATPLREPLACEKRCESEQCDSYFCRMRLAISPTLAPGIAAQSSTKNAFSSQKLVRKNTPNQKKKFKIAKKTKILYPAPASDIYI